MLPVHSRPDEDFLGQDSNAFSDAGFDHSFYFLMYVEEHWNLSLKSSSF